MSVVPKKTVDMIQFFENHNVTWSANAVAIGTTAGAVTDLETKTGNARALYTAQSEAKQAMKQATTNLRVAKTAMATAGAAIIKQIRAKAEMTGDSVYGLAGIPIPGTPTPVPAPGTPTDFKAQLQPQGEIEVSFKCANPVGGQGTVYEIARKLGDAATFETIATVGTKKFVDDTLPRGTEKVTYGITAIRSTKKGVSGVFTVYFGVGASGEMIATIGPSNAKMAA